MSEPRKVTARDIDDKTDYSSSLEEDVARLRCLVAYLLEKNELLRRTIATQNAGGSP